MKPLFELGQVVVTPNAVAALESVGTLTKTLLHSHVTGDWGNIVQSAKDANDHAVGRWEAIRSSYQFSKELTVWVITEWDRSVTTVLLPSDY